MIDDMKPLWIIDLRDNQHERLESCLESINKQEKQKWMYTRFGFSVTPYTVETFRNWRNQIIEEAKKQVNNLLQYHGLNTKVFHICVLGDITSEQTRALFPFLSIILRRGWRQVLPNHTETGVSTGALCYIPTEVNQHNSSRQNTYALCLEELALLHKERVGEMYDYMVTYGDIQPIGHQTFTSLNKKQQDELTFQYLLNIYYMGDNSIVSPDSSRLFCHAGAISCFYDSEYARKLATKNVLEKMLQLFRQKQNERNEQSEVYTAMQYEVKSLLETSGMPLFISEKSILKSIVCNDTDITADMHNANTSDQLHPIRNCWKSWLYPSYYLNYLRCLPARLNEYLTFYTNELQRSLEKRLQQNREMTFENTCKALRGIFTKFWDNTQYHYKTLGQAETLLHEVINLCESEQNKLKSQVLDSDITPIKIPDFLQYYTEELKNQGKENYYQHILENLKAILQREATFLGAIIRCLLIGITGMFCILPLLKLISPEIINLGNITRYEYVWNGLILIIPFLIFGWKAYRHFRLIKKMKNQLWAYCLTQLNERLWGQLKTEAQTCYTQIQQYCKKKLAECEALRTLYKPAFNITSNKFMETFFNHPIENFITDKSLLENKIETEGRKINVNELTEQHLYNLLATVLQGKSINFVNDLPADEKKSKQKVEEEISILFEDLQKLFVPNPHADIHHLVEHCLSADDWETIFKQTFPIGIFVDGASDKEEYVLKTNKFLHLNKITHHIEQEIDSNGDAGILFISRFQYINELIISRFLSLDMSDIHFPSNTSIELTCYYAFYNKDFIKNGKFYNISIENKRLATINKILTN